MSADVSAESTGDPEQAAAGSGNANPNGPPRTKMDDDDKAYVFTYMKENR